MIMRHIHAQQQAQLANAQKYSGSALYNYSGSTPLQVQQAAMLQNLILDSRQQQQPPQQHQQQQQQQQVSYTFLS